MSDQLPPHELELMELFNRDVSQAERNRLIELLSTYPELSNKYAFYLHLLDLELAEMPEPDPVIHDRLMKIAAKQSLKVKLAARFDALLNWLTQPLVSGPAVLCLVFLVGYELMDSTRSYEDSLLEAEVASEEGPSQQIPHKRLETLIIADLDEPVRDQVVERQGTDAVSTTLGTTVDSQSADEAFGTPPGIKRPAKKDALGSPTVANRVSNQTSKRAKVGSPTKETVLLGKSRASNKKRADKVKPSAPTAPKSLNAFIGASKDSLDVEGIIGEANGVGSSGSLMIGSGSRSGGLSSTAGGSTGQSSRSKREASETRQTRRTRNKPSPSRKVTPPKRKRVRVKSRGMSDSEGVTTAMAIDEDTASDDVLFELEPAEMPAPARERVSAWAGSNPPAPMAASDSDVEMKSKQTNIQVAGQQEPSPKAINTNATVSLTAQESSRLRRAKDDLNFRRSKSDEILGLARLALKANDLEQAATWTQWVIQRNDKRLRDALDLRRQIQTRRNRP